MDTNTSSQNIFSIIRKEANDFYFNWVSVVPGYSFNQYYTIKRIHLYLNSKYEDGGQYLGRDKIFFNIVVPPCEVATRMLNLDTKDIRLWPLNPKSQFSTYLLEKELKQWLKTSKLGQILNQLAEDAPRYGTVVLEKTTDGAKMIDLRRLIIDPTVEKIQNSRFVTTVHYMTPTELRETGWQNADIAATRFANTSAQEPYEDRLTNVNLIQSSPYIKVYKRYGEVPQWWVDDTKKPGTKEGEKMTRSLFIVAGVDNVQKNSEGKAIGENGLILFKSKWTKPWPFKDFHYTKTKGRYLGVGIVEMLFDIQMRINELRNQTRIGMEISSLHLFQTKDKQIVRNVLTDLQSGDLIISNNGIEPINDNEGRFHISAQKMEEESYLGQVDKLSFAYEALRGETPASSTPLGVTQIAVAQSASVFAFKRENLALFLQDFFNELVMPQLMKDLTPEHIMRFTGTLQELDTLDQAAAEVFANDHVKQMMLNGQMPTPEIEQAAKQKAIETYRKLGESRFIKIKDAFYKDAEFEFDFLITGEQEDPQRLVNNLQAVIQSVAANPAILDDPRIKLLFYKFTEKLGISPAEIELADQQNQKVKQAQQAQQLQVAQSNQQQNGQQNRQQPNTGTTATGQPASNPLQGITAPQAGAALTR